MNDKSGIALGVGTPAYKGDTMYAVDEVSIGKIEVNANTFAGIIHGDNSNKDTILKLNTVDINSGTLDLGAKNKINATFTYGYKAPTIQSANSDGSINVNFNNDTSSLVLGNIGSKDTKNPVSLNLNFNNAALTGNDNSVSFGKDVTIADGSSINAIAVDGFIKGMNAEQTAQKLADKVFDASTDQNKNAVAQLTNTKAHIAAAGINEGYSYDVDKNTGEIITSSVAVTENTATHSLSQLNAISYMQWRSAMNHLQYRMGELRDHKGLNNGVWLRVYNGKDKYGSQNVANTYFGFQTGYDRRIDGTNVLIGGAISYTHGDSDFNVGEGSNYNFDFTAYATWLADNGFFIDGTVKAGRIANDINLNSSSSAGAGSASYNTNAFSVSAELGWRAALTDWAYLEPQAEIMYGRIDDADYRFNDISVSNDAIDTTIGRLGMQAGLKLPDNQGGVYLRASVLHDFNGEITTKFSQSGFNSTYITEDLGDTWYELGIGAHYNVSETAYIYADFNYTDGGEVESPWRWSLGVRQAF